MNKPIRLVIVIASVAVLAGIGGCWLGRSKSTTELAKYKAELRAKGEKLSWAELGYPLPPETNKSLSRLVVAVDQMSSGKIDPGLLALQDYVGPGRARVAWRGDHPRLTTNAPVRVLTWAEFVAVFQQAEPELREIRAALESPPRYFIHDPTNFPNLPKIPFVQQRKAAQWLSGDTIRALHEQRLDEVQANLHALTQLIHLHEDDPTLVSQMIRIAIAGLALLDTWEALAAEGWSEEALAALQRDWEAVTLTAAVQRGIESERAFGEMMFGLLDEGSESPRNLLVVGANQSRGTFEDYLGRWVVLPIWRANRNEDELFYLRQYQQSLTAIRELGATKSWSEVNAELHAIKMERDAALAGKMATYRHLVSALMTPNTRRAVEVGARNELQRRLTVTAIALKRYELRHGAPPITLTDLMPDFLQDVPIDLMSGEALRYRRTDQGFILYSIGEDGIDDGGDASSVPGKSGFDLWSGRDAVWPMVAGTED